MEIDLHGGDLYKTATKYGIRQGDLLDFSSNINPLGLSLNLRTALVAGIDDLVNYPDPECTDLREALSEYTGVPKEAIIAGNGASELIYLLMEVLCPKKILMPAPCFAEYSKAAHACGAQVRYYRLKEKDDFRLDMLDFVQEIAEDIDTVLMCNPNNPTSVLITKGELHKLLEYTDRKGIRVIMDEAFIELTVGGCNNSVVGYMQQYKNLFVIRAFTKIFAIPGLRLGYALGDVQFIQQMWERKLPWSVNTLACSVGRSLTQDHAYLKATADWLSEEKDWLYSQLKAIESFKVYTPDSNFILIKLRNMDVKSSQLKVEMIQRGILIRDASNFMFLDDTYVRVAIKDRKSNGALIQELMDIF